MLFDVSTAVTEQLHDELFIEKGISVSVLRLDRIHPVISGNKLFKLHYFLEEAIRSAHRTIVTFGGAYSNHLAATAYACGALGLKSIGIVRGEESATLSHTLLQCRKDGMQLKFISRTAYAAAATSPSLPGEHGECLVIPEGGYHPMGARGAALIMNLVDTSHTHICTALGTATTLAGLALHAKPHQQLIGIPVVKEMNDLDERIKELTGFTTMPAAVECWTGYHFGGYAKKNEALIHFINQCWQQYRLPLDFVYTAKMFYAVTDQAKKNHFPPGSRILCLHTGGLQGNGSLPPNTLAF